MIEAYELLIRIGYAVGYLQAMLGSPTVELSDEARKRIEHAIATLQGNPASSPLVGKPDTSTQVLQ